MFSLFTSFADVLSVCPKTTSSVAITPSNLEIATRPANIYLLKVIIERLENGVKYVNNMNTINDIHNVVLVSLSITLNTFHTFFWCIYCDFEYGFAWWEQKNNCKKTKNK